MSFFSSDVYSWMLNCFDNGSMTWCKGAEWKIMFAVTCWWLWKKRNSRIFQGENCSADDTNC